MYFKIVLGFYKISPFFSQYQFFCVTLLNEEIAKLQFPEVNILFRILEILVKNTSIDWWFYGSCYKSLSVESYKKIY